MSANDTATENLENLSLKWTLAHETLDRRQIPTFRNMIYVRIELLPILRNRIQESLSQENIATFKCVLHQWKDKFRISLPAVTKEMNQGFVSTKSRYLAESFPFQLLQ